MVIVFQLLLGTARHLRQYFAYKALLRKARVEYQQTGVKTNLDMAGYTSLNTLMGSVVVNIYGLFALGSGVRTIACQTSTDRIYDIYSKAPPLIKICPPMSLDLLF